MRPAGTWCMIYVRHLNTVVGSVLNYTTRYPADAVRERSDTKLPKPLIKIISAGVCFSGGEAVQNTSRLSLAVGCWHIYFNVSDKHSSNGCPQQPLLVIARPVRACFVVVVVPIILLDSLLQGTLQLDGKG